MGSIAFNGKRFISVGAGIELLWTNASPMSNFAAQTVSLDLSGYNAVSVVFYASTSSETEYFALGRVGNSMSLHTIGSLSVAMSYVYKRTAKVNADGIEFNASYRKALNSSSAASASSAYCIPVAIYGINGIC